MNLQSKFEWIPKINIEQWICQDSEVYLSINCLNLGKVYVMSNYLGTYKHLISFRNYKLRIKKTKQFFISPTSTSENVGTLFTCGAFGVEDERRTALDSLGLAGCALNVGDLTSTQSELAIIPFALQLGLGLVGRNHSATTSTHLSKEKFKLNS